MDGAAGDHLSRRETGIRRVTQVNVAIPDGVAGDQPIVLWVGDVPGNSAVIAISSTI